MMGFNPEIGLRALGSVAVLDFLKKLSIFKENEFYNQLKPCYDQILVCYALLVHFLMIFTIVRY